MLVKTLQTNLADPNFQPSDAEERMALEGRDRYRRRQDKLALRGTAAERDDYASVIKRSLLGVADKISEAVEKDKGRRGTKRSRLLLKVEAIEAVTVAYITLSTIFNSLSKTNDKAKIATQIGIYLQNEANFHFIKDQAPAAWSRLVKYAKEHGSDRHQTNFVLNAAEKDGIEAVEWSMQDRSLLGEWLIGLAAEAELITVRSTNASGSHTASEIVLQDHVLDWLEEYRSRADAGSLPMITPVLSPLAHPPRDWSTPRNGGYAKLRFPLVKQGLADYDNADMSRVYRAVNLMQRTAWHINGGMLDLVQALWAEGQKVGKLPVGLQKPVPERVAQEAWESWTPEQRKGWMLELREIHADNRQAACDLTTINMVLAQANELRDEPEIYMPYQLDYRGRSYCMPLLSPQGADYVRALLEFSHGKPIGERGAMWLAIQAATLWDGEYRGQKLSKASFQDRYDWTVENEAFLRSVVNDPLGDRTWANADKPFMFLRTAIGWVEFLDVGENFVSNVPVSIDGSCSGIQHYAALLRDKAAGSRVNLIPSETPADVYGDVAAMLIPLVEADIGNNALLSPDKPVTVGEAAEFWKAHGITRKVVKKPVMTYGYSSREPGFTDWYDKEYVRPAMRAQGRRNVPSEPIARYLAKKTLTAVEQCLPSVAIGMDWLIACARLLAHEGKGIAWTAPSGLPVVQRYMSAPSVRVETMLGGERLRVSVPGSSKTVNKEKQKNAVSPNHTHSLDAAHLVLTVLQAHDYGIDSFSLIHDSFGTLAADVDAMFAATRDAFVTMYEGNDPFQHLYEQVYEALSEKGREKLPLPPAKGTLDLSQVQQSLYAFA